MANGSFLHKQSSNLITTNPPSTIFGSPMHIWPAKGVISGDPGSGSDDLLQSRVSHQESILIGIIHTLGLVLALIGNCSVIVIIARTGKLHTASSLQVLVLAISDLLLSFFWNLVPMLLTFDDGVFLMLMKSNVACNVIGIAWQTMLTISTLSHSIVAFDRYLFIVHPMKYQVYVTIKATSILTCVIVVIASLLSALTLITRTDFRLLQMTGMCIGSPIWSVLYLFVIFIPSLSVALFAYQRIWKLCASIFKQENINASRCQSPHKSISNKLPPFSLSSSRDHSRSDLSTITEMGAYKIYEECKEQNPKQEKSIDTEVKSKATHKQKQQQQQHITTTFTTHHTTTVTRKNTTTTTTIASGPCEPSIPIEGPYMNWKDRQGNPTVGRKISEVTEVSETTEKGRKCSVTVHKSSSITTPSNPSTLTSIKPCEICVNEHNPGPSTYYPDVQQIPESKPKGRSYSKDSIIPFLTRQQRNYQNPFIVTTSAESMSSIPNLDRSDSAVNYCPNTNTANLSIFDTIRSSPEQTRYETITGKLFGSQAILPSLLYVAILMPLSMRPVSTNFRRRRLRVCLVIGLPVLIIAVGFLPFPGSLIYLGYVRFNTPMEGGSVATLIKLICHFTYALVPSLTSLLLCLNNKPYRRALRQTFSCCRCVLSR